MDYAASSHSMLSKRDVLEKGEVRRTSSEEVKQTDVPSQRRLSATRPCSGLVQRRLSKYLDSRRIWLHLGSKEVGPKIAAIFSIVKICHKLDVPIPKYLAEVLPGLADRCVQSLAELTPTDYAAESAK
jgi:hypothetical protein